MTHAESPPVSVLVVIVTYESADDIGACLRSVAARTTVDHEVVVVDNASEDGTAALVASAFPAVTLIENPDNVGFARAVNIGAAAMDSRFVLLLNPDTELRTPAIDRLVAAADDAPEHRIYGGRTFTPDGESDPLSAWGLPSVWSLVCFATGLTTLFKRHRLFDPESLGRWPRDSRREVPAVSGCLQLVDRDLWEQVGGLDERYFMYGEDADWAMRAREAGARPVLEPRAEIMHRVGASSISERKRVMVLTGKATYIRAHWSKPSAALGLLLLQAGALLRGPVANLIRRGVGRPKDASWAAAWAERARWRAGW